MKDHKIWCRAFNVEMPFKCNCDGLPVDTNEFNHFNEPEVTNVTMSAYDNVLWGFLFLIVFAGSLAINWKLGAAVFLVVAIFFSLQRNAKKNEIK